MSPLPHRDTTAGRVFNDLRNMARHQGRGTDELLIRYTLERWLYRLSMSTYADAFILKGALLLAVLDARRPTRDADLLARGVDADQTAIAHYVTDIASLAVDDGITFATDQVRIATIREDNHYAGSRVTMPATIGRARTKLSLDINIGDPVTPGVVTTDYPQLLDTQPFPLRTYPIATVLAEKITACIELELGNTRERDYADIWRIMQTNQIDGTQLTTALTSTITYRNLSLLPLAPFAAELGKTRHTAYTAWLTRQTADSGYYPAEYSHVVADVSAFADPVITGAAHGLSWNPHTQHWCSPDLT